MFAWGNDALRTHFPVDRNRPSPRFIDHFVDNKINVIAPGETCCYILLTDGSFLIFGNDGYDPLENTPINVAGSGDSSIHFSDLFGRGKRCFVRGDNDLVYCLNFEPGLNADSSTQLVLRPLDGFYSKKVVQISCGESHTVFLLENGVVFAEGDNGYGQLGIDSTVDSGPNEVLELRGIHVSRIATGSWHSFAITTSGRVYGWGKNDKGQLGLGDETTRDTPTLLSLLSSQVVSDIAAGNNHSVVLTVDGGVFTFGDSSKGQLGHGTTGNTEVNPKKVAELMGSEVTQIVCGKNHTLAYTSGSSNVFAWGDNEHEQIGIGYEDIVSTPTIVNGPWSPLYNKDENHLQYPGSLPCKVKEIAAGGDQSYVVVRENDSPRDYRVIPAHRKVLTLNDELANEIAKLNEISDVPEHIIQQLNIIFSSESSLCCSFLADHHFQISSENHGINLMKARLLFSRLSGTRNEKVYDVVKSALQDLLNSSNECGLSTKNIESLRIFLILPELQFLHDPKCIESLLLPFINHLFSLDEKHAKILDEWYQKLEATHFTKVIGMCQQCIVSTLKESMPESWRERNLKAMLKLLKRLNTINNLGSSTIVKFQKFYIPELHDLLTEKQTVQDYQKWIDAGNKFCFCKYSFVFSTKMKIRLLHIESRWEEFKAVNTILINQFSFNQGTVRETRFTQLVVNRDHLIADALTIPTIQNLKKPFRVKFEGEEGVDDGGLRKEFFMLVLEQILDPKFGLFKEYEDSNVIWFLGKRHSDDMYLLVGTLCGLAIYNSSIINLNFPLALYKKLCDQQPTLDDLKDLDSVLASSFKQVLEEDEENIEDFCLTFTTTEEVDLIPNGSRIPVTVENRRKYVEAYVNYIFTESVKGPYEKFKEGFNKVCNGKVMELFKPEELMEMVAGNQNYDWNELQRRARYKGEFGTNHQIIIWFWKVFLELSPCEKTAFLLFLTGSKKIPIDGLDIIIQPLREDETFLPVAHTCYNLLDLPDYGSEKILRDKLKLALKCNGFNIV